MSPKGGTYGVVELREQQARQPATRALAPQLPDPLVRLERRLGLRSSPIVMVLMLALHHQRQTCATSGAISDRTGQRSGWKRF
jgi:hypothetical protein